MIVMYILVVIERQTSIVCDLRGVAGSGYVREKEHVDAIVDRNVSGIVIVFDVCLATDFHSIHGYPHVECTCDFVKACYYRVFTVT